MRFLRLVKVAFLLSVISLSSTARSWEICSQQEIVLCFSACEATWGPDCVPLFFDSCTKGEMACKRDCREMCPLVI